MTHALGTLDPQVRVDALLVDYRIELLRPLSPTAATVPVVGSPEGDCYRWQQPLRPAGTADTVIAPISVRGDRLGVLRVTSAVLCPDGDVTAPFVQLASRLASRLGEAIIVADRATDVYRQARRAQSLTLAAEMQWDTSPGHSLDLGYAMLAGQLEPAYQVVGDVYDWVAEPAGASALIVDGSGYGSQAAGNTAIAVSAVRNARREGCDLVGTARLSDQAIYARHQGSLTASSLLVELDAAAHRLGVVAAGSGALLVADAAGVRRVELDDQPPLGAEEDHPYTAQELQLSGGDRVVIASDGLVEARVDQALFGETMIELIDRHRSLAPAELVRQLIHELRAFHAGNHLADDAVVVCLDVT